VLDVSRHEIRGDDDGTPGILERIAGIIAGLGYVAAVRQT
jgi:hypothetical protein